MKKYSDILRINPIFQNSINLQFDINSEQKINEYIPTKEACEILRRYISSVLSDGDKNDRATVLYGPYGKGKSFLILVLLFLISSDPNNETYRNLVNRFSLVDDEIVALLKRLNGDGIRLLPVIVNSDYDDINQAFLTAIKEAQDREGIDNIVPETAPDVALEVVERWMEKDSSNSLHINQCASEKKVRLDELKAGLEKNNPASYKEFCDLFSCVSGGMPFNPLIKKNVAVNLNNIAKRLPDEYSGFFIVFDEFSKFLESGVAGLTQQMKELQDIFELSVRSDNKAQIHLCCINHKKLASYSKGKQATVAATFKTIEGRVRQISFTRSIGENYWIISQAIEKKTGFEKFWKDFWGTNQEYYSWFVERGFVEEDLKDDLFKGCFPLNPISTYTLIQLSEMVAQNERTLFTFISDSNVNSVNSFIHNNCKTLYSVDKIYDYFSSLLEKEESIAKDIWINAEAIIKEIVEDDERRVVKAVALSQIIDDSRLFPATSEFISRALNLDCNEIINDLKNRDLLSYNVANNRYKLCHHSDKDIRKAINEYRLTHKFQNVNEELNDVTPIHYVPARKYNTEYKMTRFYKVSYMDIETFSNLQSLVRSNSFSDGTIYQIYSAKQINVDSIEDNYKRKGKDSCIVVGCYPNMVSYELFDDLSDYCALRDLIRAGIVVDSVFFHEMEIMMQRKKESIQQVLNSMFSATVWFSDINEENSLSSIMFRQLSEEYAKTPIINNELLNKDEPTKTYQGARDKVVKKILDKEDMSNFSETSAERFIFNSVFYQGNGIENVVKAVINFLENEEGVKVPFSGVVNLLTSAPYGIRKGIIPLIIARAVSELPEHFVIYYGTREKSPGSSEIAKAVEKPSEYRYVVVKGSKEKEDFLKGLASEFDISTNGLFWNDLKYVVSSLTKYFSSLPAIIRTGMADVCLGIGDGLRKMINAFLRYDINCYEVVFVTLKKCFVCENFFDLLNEIHSCHELLEITLSNYEGIVVEDIKDIFDSPNEESLKSAFDTWIIKNNIRDKSKDSLSVIERRVLDVMLSDDMSFSDRDTVNLLSKAVTTVMVADWQRERREELIDAIKNTKHKIETASFMDKKDEIANESEPVELSSMGVIARRMVLESFNEIGESITSEEKISVLKSLIMEFKK